MLGIGTPEAADPMNRKNRHSALPRTRPAARRNPDEAPKEPPAPAPSLDAEIKPRPPDLPAESRADEDGLDERPIPDDQRPRRADTVADPPPEVIVQDDRRKPL